MWQWHATETLDGEGHVLLSVHRFVANRRGHHALWEDAQLHQREIHELLSLEGWAPHGLYAIPIDEETEEQQPIALPGTFRYWLVEEAGAPVLYEQEPSGTVTRTSPP